MKKISLLIGLLLLTACTPKEKGLSLEQWKDCLKQAADTEYYGLERLHSEARFCLSHTSTEFKFEPMYEEFYLCASYFGNPMFDLPPETNVYAYRQGIYNCVYRYPGEKLVHVPPYNIFREGSKARVLIGDELHECRYYPTATGYSEDFVCP